MHRCAKWKRPTQTRSCTMPRVRRECSFQLALVFFEPCSNIHCVSSKHMRCTSKALTKLQQFLPSQWLPFGASEEEALRKPFPGFFFDRVFFFVPLCGFLKKSHFGDRPLQPQITLRDENTSVPRHRRSRSRLPLHHHQGRRRRLIDGTRR